MKKYYLGLAFILLGFNASAQKYRTAAGIRIGRDDFGGSIQQKIMEKSTLEGIFAAGNREVSGTVLLERHFPILGKGLNYYIGAGAHIGNLKDSGTFYGGDGIVGLEMKVPILPVLLSLDFKPAIHANHEDWSSFSGGFSVRYILVKEKKEKKRFGIFGGGDSDDKPRKKKDTKNDPPKKGIFGF